MPLELIPILALIAMFVAATLLPINMGTLGFVAAFLVGTLAVGEQDTNIDVHHGRSASSTRTAMDSHGMPIGSVTPLLFLLQPVVVGVFRPTQRIQSRSLCATRGPFLAL